MTVETGTATMESTIADAVIGESAPAQEATDGGPLLNGISNYTDGYAYEVPRPFLTLPQAAAVLGKSMRAIERSLLGRWGNKLPDGWVARKMKTEQGDQWRILPPPGFRVKLQGTEYDTAEDDSGGASYEYCDQPSQQQLNQAPLRKQPLGKQERRLPQRHSLDQPAIVIDRSEEVEHLLRELVSVQKTLADERRTHMEDLRMITQLQSSLRLLEVNAAQQAKTKTELELAKHELTETKARLTRWQSLPWWRRIFVVQD